MVNCQTEANEDAYTKMKLGSRGSAWSTNIDVVSLLNSSNATTVTWCESFLQAVFPHFLFFFKQKTAYEITTRLVGSEMCIRDSVTVVALLLFSRETTSMFVFQADPLDLSFIFV